MPNFKVLVSHESSRTEVVQRLKTYSIEMQDDVPVQVTEIEEVWDDSGNLVFAFKAMGLKFSGTVITCEQQITVKGSMPFAALPFRGAIENQVSQKIRQALETG